MTAHSISVVSVPPGALTVVLVADGAARLEALQPAGEVLGSFSVAWDSCFLNPDDPDALPRFFGAHRHGGATRAIIVASGDALLPGALAERTGQPVIRVPVGDDLRQGIDLLRDETGNLPAAAPGAGTFATMAIGEAGARNAALFVVSMLALEDARLRTEWLAFRARQTEAVRQHPPLSEL